MRRRNNKFILVGENMSGGSFEYGYTKIKYDYAGYMQDICRIEKWMT